MISRSVNVILRKDLENYGMKGQEIVVKPGYARNALYPQGSVVYATAYNRLKYKNYELLSGDNSGAETEIRMFKRWQRRLQTKPLEIKRQATGANINCNDVTYDFLSIYSLIICLLALITSLKN